MRLAKPSYGPLAPPVREHGADPETWGRYDVMGHRTLYAGKNLEAAYSEILAYLAPKNALLDSDLRAYFPTSPGKSLDEVIEEEWETLFSIKPTTVVRSFRSDYSEYALTLPGQGWFVDIEHASSISVLNKVFGEQLAAFDVERLTLGTLHSEERLLTTAFAEFMHNLVLFDGSSPHGIQFTSKHGARLTCWAVWLRQIDAGEPTGVEPTTSSLGHEIMPPAANPPLRRVCDRLGITVH